MENSSICTHYSDRLAHYAGFGFLLGGLSNLIFFKRVKTGALMGFGLGAGYCHNEFITCFKTLFMNEKLHLQEQPTTLNN